MKLVVTVHKDDPQSVCDIIIVFAGSKTDWWPQVVVLQVFPWWL